MHTTKTSNNIIFHQRKYSVGCPQATDLSFAVPMYIFVVHNNCAVETLTIAPACLPLPTTA